MATLLEEIEFRNAPRARGDLERVGRNASEAFLSRLYALLAASPDADQALHFLERLHTQQPDAFQEIARIPVALRYTIAIFSYSTFLSDAVLRYPDWILDLASNDELDRVLSTEDLTDRLVSFLGPERAIPSALDLARFRRRQLLRVVLRDVLGLAALAEIT